MSGRRYSPDHLWIDPDGRVGVTAHLLAAFERIDALHLPAVGDHLRVAEPFGALEGDKGVVDLYAPCDGVVRAVNEGALARPDEMGPETWLVEVDGQPGPLLDERAYAARVAAKPFRRGGER